MKNTRPAGEESDRAELVAAAKAGDRSALDRLCDLCYDEILQYFHARIPAHAEDLTQQLFASLDRKLQAYEESGRFMAWLRGVAYHMFLTQLRSDRRRREDTFKPGVDVMASETSTLYRTKKGELRQVALELPRALRETWHLHVQGLSHAEIATRLGIAKGAVMTRLSRARALLSKWLLAEDTSADEPV